jgi:hypothetical protein
VPFLHDYSLQTAATAIADEIAAIENNQESHHESSSGGGGIIGIKLDKGVLLYSSWQQRLTSQHKELIQRVLESPEKYSCHRRIHDIVNDGMLLAPVEEQLRAEQEADSSEDASLSASERARLFAGPDGGSEQLGSEEVVQSVLSDNPEAGIDSIFRTFYTNALASLVRRAANEGRQTITEEEVREYFSSSGRDTSRRRRREM